MSDNEETLRVEENEEQTYEERLDETERLTTQWSVEDEEEAARERRRRERQQQYQEGSEGQSPEDLREENCTQSNNHVGLKPAGPWETEEDEGFSDWSQKLEQRRLRGAAEAVEEKEEDRHREEGQSDEPGATEEASREAEPKAEEEEDEGTSRYEAAEVNEEPDPCTYDDLHKPETLTISSNQWETREFNDHEEDRAPSPRAQEEEYENQQEESRRPEDKYDHSTVQAVPSPRRSVGDDEEESEGGLSVKITDRAEVLNRSIQKSNSVKRSEPPLPINKIDDRLEQYTHAIESSAKTGRLARTPSLEALSPDEAVSDKKNRWEAGDVTTASKAPSCKDTDGINIGVSDMINQWGKGKSEVDGNVVSQKITEVKPGEVLSKKGLWEQSPKSGQSNKSVTPSKKYKFVPTGHGKYEKILVEDP